MIYESTVEAYKIFRLMNYRDIFCRIKEKDGSLSATEAFAADVIYLLGTPTICEFAEYLGISQPNATYKANNLVEKGYITKFTPPDDKRECRLSVGDKFYTYFDTEVCFIKNAVERLEEQFSHRELKIFENVLQALTQIMRKTEE